MTLTGTTFGQAAALELAPGCPGYLDAETPGHVLTVSDALPFSIQARSEDGPVALAVASGDEVRCDSDEGSGHAPTLSFEGPGDYQIFVAALRQPAELAYELSVRGAGAPDVAADAPAGDEVSVTITSDPAGAQVRDPDGNVVGTTPAMFVVNVPPDQRDQDRSWILALADHRETTVTGRLNAGAVVLHGHLPTLAPTNIDVTAAEPQPIRDYRSASLAVEVAEECAITAAEVEVDIQHTFIGDLRVVLRTPWGEELTLHRHAGGGRRNLQRTWDMDDRALAGLANRSTRGRWTLVVHDDAGADQGSLERFGLRLTCGPEVAVAAVTPTPDPDPPDVDPAPTPNRPTRPTPRRPSLPDLPTRADIVRVLGGLRPRVESCGTQGGNVRVIATVNGSTGRVTQVSTTGSASDAERSCVARVVRTARFDRFRRNVLDVDYTYDLPARGQSAGVQGNVMNPFAQP